MSARWNVEKASWALQEGQEELWHNEASQGLKWEDLSKYGHQALLWPLQLPSLKGLSSSLYSSVSVPLINSGTFFAYINVVSPWNRTWLACRAPFGHRFLASTTGKSVDWLPMCQGSAPAPRSLHGQGHRDQPGHLPQPSLGITIVQGQGTGEAGTMIDLTSADISLWTKLAPDAHLCLQSNKVFLSCSLLRSKLQVHFKKKETELQRFGHCPVCATNKWSFWLQVHTNYFW